MFGLFWMRPWALAFIPVALILGALIVRTVRDLGDWERAMDPHLLAAMQGLGRISGGAPRRAWLPAFVLAALGVALAGPGIERRDIAGYRNLDAVVLVVDLSPSVTQDPRLFEALTAARLVVQSAGTRQIGLIVFAAEAYEAASLTTDPNAMDGILALIDGETMPVDGSNAATGLLLAEEMLAEAQIVAADVVLVSDGGGLGPEAFASVQRLAAAKASVSVLAMAPNADLDALVRIGQGELAPIDDPFPVAQRIADRAATRLAETDYVMLVIRDLGRPLLILALIGAVFLLPRGGVAQ